MSTLVAIDNTWFYRYLAMDGLVIQLDHLKTQIQQYYGPETLRFSNEIKILGMEIHKLEHHVNHLDLKKNFGQIITNKEVEDLWRCRLYLKNRLTNLHEALYSEYQTYSGTQPNYSISNVQQQRPSVIVPNPYYKPKPKQKPKPKGQLQTMVSPAGFYSSSSASASGRSTPTSSSGSAHAIHGSLTSAATVYSGPGSAPSGSNGVASKLVATPRKLRYLPSAATTVTTNSHLPRHSAPTNLCFGMHHNMSGCPCPAARCIEPQQSLSRDFPIFPSTAAATNPGSHTYLPYRPTTFRPDGQRFTLVPTRVTASLTTPRPFPPPSSYYH